MPRVIEVTVPEASKIWQAVSKVYFADAYQVRLSRPTLSVEDAYAAILGHMPQWAKALMTVRGWAVAPFGLKHPNAERSPGARYQVGQRAGLFTIQSIDPHEVIAGDDDKHLDFRVSVYKAAPAGAETVTVSTVVEIHNMLGRVYIAIIKPFHRLIVRSMVQNAVDAGRL